MNPNFYDQDDPILSREDAIAILDTPDEKLDDLIARAEDSPEIQRQPRQHSHSDKCPQRQLFPGLCLLCPVLPFQSGY